MVKDSINYDFPERLEDDVKENSLEDKTFLTQVSESIHIRDGHYSIGLPFKDPLIQLPNNIMQGFQRLESLKKKLIRDPKVRNDYVTFMNKLFEKGYAEPVPQSQLQREDGRVWYLPHHGVYNDKKPGKIRVVFDCSAVYMGISLNSQLLQGPDLTNSLLGVLLRFRQEKVAIQGDIEAMFHQVSIPEQDRDCLRFLWWKDGNLDASPEQYRMKVHIFGATSSPTCCNYALQQTAKEYGSDFDPTVMTTVLRNMYVDDCLSSVDTEKKAALLIEDLSTLCSKGGFHLTKWISNSKQVLESVPEEDRAKDVQKWNLECESETLVERALGVYWLVNSDRLGFLINIKNQPMTRRGILSIVSSVFDPLGIVSHFVMTAKTLLQKMCKNSVGWDEEITGCQLKDWKNWLTQAKELENVTLKRCYKPQDFGKMTCQELHCFADASEVGIGVVIYLRLVSETGKIHCSFVLGKSRVAPLKTVTIPRLELTASTLAVKLCKIVTKQLDYQIDQVYFWTDSMSVLRYIKNTKTRFHTFVANRLAIIHAATTINQWHYVTSKLNPADCASRGIPVVSRFLDSASWFSGPEFLWKPDVSWPSTEIASDLLEIDSAEIKESVNTAVETETVEGIERLLRHFSSWKKLKTVTGWLLLARENLKIIAERKSEQRSRMVSEGFTEEKIQELEMKEKHDRLKNAKQTERPSLNADILDKAETNILKYVQMKYFAQEFKDLNSSENGVVKRSSKLAKLDPIVHNGVLRVGGRLKKLDTTLNSKHQIIIPKESVLARLIAEEAHKSVGHLGKNSTLARIREKYWILGVSSIVKSIISRCVICRKYQAPALKQKMADLPSERLKADDPPFTRVGMDYFGPFELKRGRSIIKRYGVIFTCLSSRAVHLEVAFSLDTDSCIDAIRRLIARRGKPTYILSDNGTNLVGAERELRTALNSWNMNRISSQLLQSGIEWSFNPPAASHFGGVWERLIRIVRKIMYSVLHEQTIHLDDEGLLTLVCEIEAIMNGRPLTEASDDPNDLCALTPNHILLMRSGESFPPGIFHASDNYAKRRWKQIQYLADVFWTRWIKEYVPLLQQRQKWLKQERNLQEGDLVLIVENTPRNTWNLGRVLEVIKDKYDVVRVARIKTVSSILTRPVTKLCLLLETDCEKEKTNQ
ncbi:uncharacterized protein LOC134282159 [Saccostrea cucullata]|uniref:uncharacterized protein LOC134282159 n=1 Tax=Saccostrea cuccullata TaxID=36930 RepID=UPI002ED48EC2